uniref:VQ domain-containing protein n=1 Tax=Oryza punctata TaxID=4537 RepID=A0A0E0ME45_ORYPU
MDTKIYIADKSTFKELVQRLTGQPPAPEPAAVAAPAPALVAGAPRRGRLTVRWMVTTTGVHNPPAFKSTPHRPKLPIIRPAHPRLLAGFASPPLSPWCSAGQCVLNMQVELPPSPPPSPLSASSTLAEEVVGEAAEEEKPDKMHQPPAAAAVRIPEAKLLNLFPLTPSCSMDC